MAGKPFLPLTTWIALLSGCTASVPQQVPEDYDFYRFYYETACLRSAQDYREGRFENAPLGDIQHYFACRTGKLTEAELKALLGDPRIVPPEDDYYRDALQSVYGYEILDDPDIPAVGKHDRVLHYGEYGPPHGVPDESLNLFFVVKDGVVVGVWGLFP